MPLRRRSCRRTVLMPATRGLEFKTWPDIFQTGATVIAVEPVEDGVLQLPCFAGADCVIIAPPSSSNRR